MKFLWPLLFFTSQALAQSHVINMIGSNGIDQNLPFEVFSSTGFKANPEMKYVKVHIFPDKPMERVFKIQFETCSEMLTAPVTFFVNFDESIEQVEPNESAQFSMEFDPSRTSKDSKKTEVSKTFDRMQPLHSLTINFNRNKNVCLKNLKFIDLDGKVMPIQVPVLVEGTASSSQTLKPLQAYSPMNLFDSRFENAWATDKVGTGAELKIQFNSEQTVEKIRFWNGYQRSLNHCQQNSRPKVMTITGDGGYLADVEVKDILGSQDLVLPKPFRGKNLTFKVKDVFSGKVYKDLVVSEMRFFDGKNWTLLNPNNHLKTIREENIANFKKAGLDFMLNQKAATINSSSDESGAADNSEFRIRSDGTFYFSGFRNNKKDETYSYYTALGSYEILEASAKGVKLRFFGSLRTIKDEFGGDCNGCGHKCNSPNAEDREIKKIFQETLFFSKAKEQQKVNMKVEGKSKMKLKRDTLWVEIQ